MAHHTVKQNSSYQIMLDHGMKILVSDYSEEAATTKPRASYAAV